MSRLKPFVGLGAGRTELAPPGIPAPCAGHGWERSRFEWRLGDGGDPAALLESFLADAGLPVHDLTRPVGRHAVPGAPCGAAVLISGAAGAAMIGADTGAPSPAPSVPDVVAVVYAPAPFGASTPPDSETSDDYRTWSLGPIEPSWSVIEHALAVGAVRELIAQGEVYQTNLVGHGSAAYAGEPLTALRRVADIPGARYPGVLAGAGWAVSCASPETLVRVAGGRAQTLPIKGTRPATARGRHELLTSAKERAEHIMIVDLARNDLARVAATGTVRVDELFAVRRWGDLWQAESTVSAELTGGTGLADLLRALCPGGSVTGAPKLAALRAVAALEPVGRGPSMGAIGWIGPDRVNLGLTIRTVAADGQRVHWWAGGGITWGSEPWAEVAEAAAKAAPLLAALGGR